MESTREPNCRRQWRATSVVAVILLLGSSPCTASAQCPTSEWIDPDTPASACTRKLDNKGRPLELVFSDEFNVDGRSFQDGSDPVWTAIATFPSTNVQENGYSDDTAYATTRGGKLLLNINNEMSHQEVFNGTSGKWVKSTRPYTSSMLQSWNKFCFSGGVVEISAQMPGNAHQEGLWPAFWLMGNLGRATFQNSTDFLWPFSYAQCPAEEDAAANSNPRRDQKINGCLGSNWTDRFGLNANDGRGAIEIDIFEVRPGAKESSYLLDKVIPGKCPYIEPDMLRYFEIQRPEILNTLQMGPGIPLGVDQRPTNECVPDWRDQWYKELKPGVSSSVYGRNSFLELNWGTYNSKVNLQTDSIGATSRLDGDAFENQHVYRLDWDNGENGYLRWTMDDESLDKPRFHLPSHIWQSSMNVTKQGKPFGALLSRKALQEPVYMLLNIDISTVWGWDLPCDPEQCACCTDCSDERCFVCLVDGQNKREWLRELCQMLPATMEIDYIRIYQQEGANQTSCSPPEAPTEGWIDTHRAKYIDSSTDEPLRPVYAGGGACLKDTHCSSKADWPEVQRGKCVDRMCQCAAGWTGPRCRARKIGAAAACAPLEEAVTGGGVCSLNTSSTALRCADGGTCVKALPWDAVRRWTTLKNNGSQQLVGGGEGRCRCHRGWVGPYCQRQLEQEEKRSCTPDAHLSSEDLHRLVKEICNPSPLGILHWQPPVEALRVACKEVLWSPHWEEGGRFSKCGVWPRASWVLQALEKDTGLCCSRLSPAGDVSCREQPYSFILLLGLGIGVLVTLACIGSAVQTHLRGGLCRSRSKRMVDPHKSFMEEEDEDTEERMDSDDLSSDTG